MAEPACGTLAIVGASARSAAQAAWRAGFNVVTADLFADADLTRHVPATRIAHYPADLLPWLRIQRATAWMYTGALENYPRLVDAMARLMPLWGNSGPTLRAVRSPWRLADCLKHAELPFPEVSRDVYGVPTDGTFLRKPLRGSNGAGIEPWIGQPISARSRVYWQRYVPGLPCAALFVAARGSARLLGVTRQLVGGVWTGAKPFQYCGTLGPWPTTPPQHEQIIRIGQTLAREFALRGLFGVDLILDRECVWTIEINPRYTAAAEIVERFSNLHPIAAHVAACRDARLPTEDEQSRPGRFYGKSILYAANDVTISDAFFESAIQQAGPSLDATLADVPSTGTRLRAGQPVLTVLARGETLMSVETYLKSRVQAVRSFLWPDQQRYL